MKRVLIAALLCLLLGTAGADTMREYTLSAADIDIKVLMELATGNKRTDVIPGYGNDSGLVYSEVQGRPTCETLNTGYFGQLWLTCSSALPDSENPSPGIIENIEPSGVAKCKLTSEEAKAMCDGWLEALGIHDAYLQSVTAFGRLEGYSGGYVLAYGQQLDGLPVYWAAATQMDTWDRPQSNRIEILVGDSGLISMHGYWSAFTPSGQEKQVLSDVSACSLFEAMGLDKAYDELCYFLTGTKYATRAIPAYRYANRFISAMDGTILQ